MQSSLDHENLAIKLKQLKMQRKERLEEPATKKDGIKALIAAVLLGRKKLG